MILTADPLTRLLTDREVSVVTGFARATLTKMRGRGEGPPFVKSGVNVRYPETQLREWIAGLTSVKGTPKAA